MSETKFPIRRVGSIPKTTTPAKKMLTKEVPGAACSCLKYGLSSGSNTDWIRGPKFPKAHAYRADSDGFACLLVPPSQVDIPMDEDTREPRLKRPRLYTFLSNFV